MKGLNFCVAFIALFLYGFVGQQASGQGGSLEQDIAKLLKKSERERLAGLKRMCILVVDVPESMKGESDVPTIEDVKQRLELRMRVNRVPIFELTDLDWKDPKTAQELKSIPSANIWCTFNVIKNTNGQFVYNLDFFVTEACTITRTGKGTIARIWERSTVGLAGKQVVKNAMLEVVDEYANALCNDYLAANP